MQRSFWHVRRAKQKTRVHYCQPTKDKSPAVRRARHPTGSFHAISKQGQLACMERVDLAVARIDR